GMVRDDALLAFERHATSKIKDAEDLLTVETLGFRGEALPSIASVSRLRLETHAEYEAAGTVIEIQGGKIGRVEDAGLPQGTAVAVRDLFFITPARRKFLKSESTELSHVAQLVTHYALAHPEKHIELHSSTHALLEAPPVAGHAERIYQVFGKETLDQLVEVAAEARLERVGLPAPPPWVLEKKRRDKDYEPPTPGEARLRGFVSRPELQKLNRNSIFFFVNRRLVRDRLLQHALTEAYRNILPGGVFPVVLLFLELPAGEVDVNVHPAKTEVRFRQSSFVHDLVRDTVRAALVETRPVPQFTRELTAQPTAGPALTPGARAAPAGAGFALQPPALEPHTGSLEFAGAIEVERAATAPVGRPPQAVAFAGDNCGGAIQVEENGDHATALEALVPLGQVRESFIVAAGADGLWIIDQHVAHERVLFERVLKQRAGAGVEGQRLLMPLVVELTPAQQAVFAEIAEELRRNGFEAEPFGARTVAVKTAPAGVGAADVERLLHELLDRVAREEPGLDLEKLQTAIAASIACHAAIKINTPLEPEKMRWLLRELAATECPMTCPHGRPVLLRYSVRQMERAFKRI
ncbi:MAG: DNA mismatch repair endonuclease MutL, partial [Terriglobales bacterium]